MSQSQRLRIGTRGSALALAQAERVAAALGDAEVVPVRTADGEPGDKSRFVRGVERALLDAEVDLAVHSAKDLPGADTDGLALVAVPGREDPADAWVGEAGSLAEVREGARVGTSSLRRRAQLLAVRPDLAVVGLRGNVDTRLAKLEAAELDGVVLAAAGLHRLRRADAIAFRFGADEMVPAPGQGSLAVQAREDDEEAARAAGAITDRAALVELTAERAAVAALEASCDTPVGICARHMDGTLAVAGFAGLPDGSEWVRDAVRGDPDQPVALAEALIDRMTAAGARDILKRATRLSD
jgi:hydroxymethylbilane synthase